MSKTIPVVILTLFLLSGYALIGTADDREFYLELITLKIESIRKLNTLKTEMAQALKLKEAEIAELKKTIEEKDKLLTESKEENEVLEKELKWIISQENSNKMVQIQNWIEKDSQVSQ